MVCLKASVRVRQRAHKLDIDLEHLKVVQLVDRKGSCLAAQLDFQTVALLAHQMATQTGTQ